MSIKDLYVFVEDYFGYKSRMLYLNSKSLEVAFIMYDAYLFKCQLDERYGSFGCGLVFDDKTVSIRLLGKKCSLNSDEESIKQSLQIVDDYCRLRLPDKFLEAFNEAYKE